jgi:hypothetical protein
MQEFSLLIAGREDNLTARETFALRHYAERRTDLNKPDSELSEDERVWRKLYLSLDKQLEKSLGDQLKEIDVLRREHERWDEMKNAIEYNISQHGKGDNSGLLFFAGSCVVGFIVGYVWAGLWWALILGLVFAVLALFIGAVVMESVFSGTFLSRYMGRLGRFFGSSSLQQAADRIYNRVVGLEEYYSREWSSKDFAAACKKLDEMFTTQVIYFQSPHESQYGARIDAASKLAATAEVPLEDRWAAAKEVLRLATIGQTQIIEPLWKLNEELGDKIRELELRVSHLAQNERREKLVEWFNATKQLYFSRTAFMNWMANVREWDIKMAQDILDSKDPSSIVYGPEFVGKMKNAATQAKQAQIYEEEFSVRRAQLKKELLGLLA